MESLFSAQLRNFETPDRPFLYLACPYASGGADAALRQARFEAANRAAAVLMKRGLKVFSPITHSHPIALVSDLPLHWEYWEDYDRAMLGKCHTVVVLMLDGWSRSPGVAAEFKIAKEMGIPILLMDEV